MDDIPILSNSILFFLSSTPSCLTANAAKCGTSLHPSIPAFATATTSASSTACPHDFLGKGGIEVYPLGDHGHRHSWFTYWTWLVGGFNPSEKYESQLGWLFLIYGKIKNVPNHQPDIVDLLNMVIFVHSYVWHEKLAWKQTPPLHLSWGPFTWLDSIPKWKDIHSGLLKYFSRKLAD